MKKSDKVIITCAVTGSIHTPTMTPHLPITPDQITAEAIAAAEAGAAMLHLHARDPETGKPDQNPELFRQFMPRIKQQTDAILNITTGGGLGMSLEDRLAPTKALKPEVCSMNMGSINFNISGAGGKISEWKFDWEKPYLEMTKDFILSNTFNQIERAMTECSAQGTRFEFECYDTAHLYNLAHFADRGLAEPPFFIQTVFGILGGIGTHPDDVAHMRRTADRLFGQDYAWSVLGAGRHQMPIAAMSLAMGGHVRVGLEDNLWAGPGRLATSSAQQVAMARRMIEELGFEVATPDEARAMLRLKGADHVDV